MYPRSSSSSPHVMLVCYRLLWVASYQQDSSRGYPHERLGLAPPDSLCSLYQWGKFTHDNIPLKASKSTTPSNTCCCQHQTSSLLCIFWALQLCSGQVFAAVHDIRNDRACGKFTTATFLGKERAILCACCFWLLQSAWIIYALDGELQVGAEPRTERALKN